MRSRLLYTSIFQEFIMAQNNTSAATITQASEPVIIIRQGQSITLGEGDHVYATDTIKTQNTPVHLAFADDSVAMLGPQSTMIVQEFSLNAADSSFVLNIVQGAVRSISGKVVEQNPDAFKVFTPKATVGIRGTDFIVQVLQDGSERQFVISLDQGHNLVVTTHSGQQLTFTAADQGGIISAGEDAILVPQAYTPEEMQDIIKDIITMLTDEEHESGQEELSSEVLELSQSLIDYVATLEEDGILNLLNDIEVSINDDEDVDILRGDDDDDLVLLGGGDDDGDDDLENVASDPTLVSFDGTQNGYGDGVDVVNDGETHIFTMQNISITEAINTNITISGDVGDISNGTVHGGDDIITGTTASNGRIVGDANTVSGANSYLVAGNDNITFDSKTGGSSIYGDAFAITNGATVTLGHDTITISGIVQNTSISGDVFTVDNTSTITAWGNDSISVGSVIGGATGATIFGDFNDSAALSNVGGNDTIVVHGALSGDNASINAGGGNDYIQVGSVDSNANILVGYGDDTVVIQNQLVSGATMWSEGNTQVHLSGGMGANANINLSGTSGRYILTKDGATGFDMSGGTVQTGANIDSILIGTMSAGTVNTGASADSIAVSTMTGGNVSGGEGNDLITINYYEGGNISGENGTDTLVITNVSGVLDLSNPSVITGVENITFENVIASGEIICQGSNAALAVGRLNGGTITGSASSDTITITDYVAGSISGQGGADILTITNITGTLDLDNIQNIATLNLTNLTGTLQDTVINDVITINHLNGGTIQSASGDDTITVENYSSGSVNVTVPNAGEVIIENISANATVNIADIMANTVTFSTVVNANTINGTNGNDTLQISIMNGGTVNGADGNDSITVTDLNGGIIDGGGGTDLLTISDIVDRSGSDTIYIQNVENIYISNGIGQATIDLQNSTVGSTISKNGTDGFDISGICSINATGYNDIIKLGNITSTVVAINGYGGNDTITANSLNGVSNSTRIIRGGDGDDSITVGEMSNGVNVYGNDGSDIITVTTLNNSSIYGESGNNVITVTTMNDGVIETDGGNDSITITTMNDPTGMESTRIKTGAGADTITTTITNTGANTRPMFDVGDDNVVDNVYITIGSGTGYAIRLDNFDVNVDKFYLNNVEQSLTVSSNFAVIGDAANPTMTIYFGS